MAAPSLLKAYYPTVNRFEGHIRERNGTPPRDDMGPGDRNRVLDVVAGDSEPALGFRSEVFLRPKRLTGFVPRYSSIVIRRAAMACRSLSAS